MNSQDLFEQAKQYIPGGVNSPVRSFANLGRAPFFTKKAKGCYLYDSDNKNYIDFVCSWGANIVGHANEQVTDSLVSMLKNGLSYGTATELETKLAAEIIQLMPSIEKIRFVSSGTEAVMSAIRLIRGYTNRKYIVKFDGCYHGHSDSLLVSAGSGISTFNLPSSSGVLPELTQYTLSLEYNNLEQLQECFNKYGENIAGVIIEPIAGNMNLIKPNANFIALLNKLCKEYNSVLIFDEVMTGFRVALNGAQSILGITPDLTILGKVIGGGMPLAAFGGKKEIMDYLAPLGPVYQAGTLSGNPVAVTCGLATLGLIKQPEFFAELKDIAKALTSGLAEIAYQHGVPFCSDYIGGMFGIYFCDHLPTNYREAKNGSFSLFKAFFNEMLNQGVYFAPSQYEAGFICSSHTLQVIDQVLEAANFVMRTLKIQ